MKDQNTLGVKLYINTGDRDPKYITEETGIDYIQIREKGKPWINYGTGETNKYRKCTENNRIYDIKLRAKNEDGVYLSQPLIEMVDFLNGNETKFKSIFADPENAMFLVVYGTIYDFHIYFQLLPELLCDLAKFKIPVEFDIYSLDNKSD